MNKITAHSLDMKPTQKLTLPVGANLLTVNVDHRFNKCLLWTYEDEDSAATEELTFTMAKLGDEAAGGKYIGTLKDNSGYLHVFAERPVVAQVPIAAKPAPEKPVEAAK
jgi:hypothetical protein